ncbi:Essential recombination function protein [uncultured Caudovirales phage]|jgi:hypothetical protein|uniref:Essential recombination function protein n=1 Tax=uncultured Caudovirales phage TaxID=2100421 RepID=A0A6J5N830_9CAUD|nr:Essential recombination function protein [uncultured Caudovirales phage]
MKQLIEIQNELKAPKNHFNKFGNYNHRVAEDILEALKPICAKHGCLLTNDDEVKELNGVLFIQSTCTIKHKDWDQSISAKGNAGIELNRKGMDLSQSFGASSSYALKRALGNLFLLDDSKDADSTNTHGKEEKEVKSKKDLIHGTPAYNQCILKLKSGEITMEDVYEKVNISNAVLIQIQNDLKNV